jgi:hypothetical protein
LASIESYVQPRRLYRYRALSNLDQELDAVTNGYLFCSPYLKLNDPMEGLFASSKLLKKSPNYRTVREAIKDNKQEIGICSFSETFDHELMWAHYADQFTGICVAYSLRRLLEHLPANVSFTRMYYDETVPTVHRTSREPSQLAKMILSYKNYRWAYEREWRMFGFQGKVHYGEKGCVTRVYFGSRIHAKNRAKVISALAPFGIKTSKMTVGEYFIDFDDLNPE